DRRSSIDCIHAALDAIRRRHGNGADLIASDVLLYFDSDLDRNAGLRRSLDAERVVQLWQMLGLELHVQDGADDLDDLAYVDFGFDCGGGSHDVISIYRRAVRRRRTAGRHGGLLWNNRRGYIRALPAVMVLRVARYWRALYSSAAAPPTISAISCVICAWRARLYVRRRTLIMSLALSVAFFIAVRRALCSPATVSTSAR